MDGTERAAVLLLGMGETQAAEVLKFLEPKQVQKVGLAMTNLDNISQIQIEKIVEDFLIEIEQQTSLGVDAEDYVRKTLTNALGQERAAPFLDRILSNNDDTGLNSLRWLDAKTISDVIRHEHPQIIATILTFLDSDQAAEIVAFFPEDKRVDLILRMSEIDSVKPEALAELGKIIEEQLAGHTGGQAASLGGLKSVADLVNNLDGEVEAQVMEGIKNIDEKLSDQIKEQMFVFANLQDMDGRSIQALLRDVQRDKLLLALKGAETAVKEKIFANMSKRAAELLKDDLEAQGPVKLTEVETAQKEILAVARKLADAGEIPLDGKRGEEMI